MKQHAPFKTWHSKKEMMIAGKWFCIGYFLASGLTILAVALVYILIGGFSL